MNNNEVAVVRGIISKIDSGEGWVFGEHVNTENEIIYKLFKDNSEKIIGVFFSCVYEEKIRIDIAFEHDIADEDINKNLLDLILYSKQKRADIADKSIDIWFFNKNRNIIKYLETAIGSGAEMYEKYNNPARVWSPYNRYASVEYIIRRENFSEEFAESKLRAKNISIKPYEKEKLDEYLIMLDRAMTFSPHDFQNSREHRAREFAEYSEADDKAFEAFWDGETGSLIGVYWRKHIEIDDIAVSPEYQRKGYGSFILTRAIKRAFENPDCEFVRLYCVDWNQKAQAFYKRYGMEVNGHSYSISIKPNE